MQNDSKRKIRNMIEIISQSSKQQTKIYSKQKNQQHQQKNITNQKATNTEFEKQKEITLVTEALSGDSI